MEKILCQVVISTRTEFAQQLVFGMEDFEAEATEPSNLVNEFVRAAQKGLVDKIKSALDAGIDINGFSKAVSQ